MARDIELLKLEDWRIANTITLEKYYRGQYMWADLIYTRTETLEYHPVVEKVETGGGCVFDVNKRFVPDLFDLMILNAVKKKYPNAKIKHHEVYANVFVEDYAKMFAGRKVEKGIVYLNPIVEWDVYAQGNVGRILTQFTIPVDIYIPCEEFCPYYKQEEFHDYFNVDETDVVKKIIDNAKPTFHTLDELWR